MARDLKDIIANSKKIHFVGIGGCGMSAIARVMLSMGYKVSGSDLKESANTIRLKELGAAVYIGHDALHIRDAQALVYTAAVDFENPELREAQNLRLPIFERAKVLGYLMSLYAESIAVAGTHGKTTTSSMLSVILARLGLDPTYMIGGEVADLHSNGSCGKSKYFVAEADESDSSIQFLDPKILILNNIEKDHLDHFSGLDDIVDLFKSCVVKLAQKSEHLLVVNSEQWGNQILLEKVKEIKNLRRLTFGLDSGANYQAVNIRYKDHGSIFTVLQDGAALGDLELAVPGEHNILNALAALTVSLRLGLDFPKIKEALLTFTGAKRRFTLLGSSCGVEIYDDYAHHPTELKATLAAARRVFPRRRIFCVFQPHRYSRTMHFLNDFAESFGDADRVFVTGIYAAGEKPIAGVDARAIVAKMNAPEKACFVEKKEDVADLALRELDKGDVFFTLGAGDIYAVGREILNRLRNRAPACQNAKEIIRIA
ncbi:MAG: UDP-N-acetylmuramate--L-alanine ligase [Candidatus Margulisbacteria bacterium]|nr:UDP-N-acetylmuramate--L-alanine ligase [Candidatus Margulisiibacteriota bacterium]